jgi:hypothetical protein
MLYNVVVEKVVYCKGIIKMEADSEIEAKDKVMKGIRTPPFTGGHIPVTSVFWNYSREYFETTGDIQLIDFMGDLGREVTNS